MVAQRSSEGNSQDSSEDDGVHDDVRRKNGLAQFWRGELWSVSLFWFSAKLKERQKKCG
jgi:hypothetical protein